MIWIVSIKMSTSVQWTKEVVIRVPLAQILWEVPRAPADQDTPEMDYTAEASNSC